MRHSRSRNVKQISDTYNFMNTVYVHSHTNVGFCFVLGSRYAFVLQLDFFPYPYGPEALCCQTHLSTTFLSLLRSSSEKAVHCGLLSHPTTAAGH